MPRPATILRIPQPCPESWAAMTPAGPGRHCAACAKTVVDFTQHSDAEMLAYFRQAGVGNTCGRFRAGQLGRPLRPALRATRPPHWQLWLAGVLAAALTVQSCQTTTTGEVRPVVAQRHLAPPPPPPLGTPADSTMVGAVVTLADDSVTVSAASPSPGEKVVEEHVLGEPEIQ